MFELFRMDMRRMFRDRKLYGFLAASFAIILVVRLIVGSDDITQIEYLIEMMHGGFLPVFGCCYAALFVCADFENGFYKHIFSAHAKYQHYIYAKILSLSVAAILFVVTAAVSSFLVSSIGNLALPFSTLSATVSITLPLLIQNWIILVGFFTMMLFFGILIKNKGILAVSIIAASGLIVNMADSLIKAIHHPEWEKFLYYTLNGLSSQRRYTVTATWHIILIGIAWILVYSITSTLLLKRKKF